MNSEHDPTFRLQVRLNRVEFGDLLDDLQQYPTHLLRNGRIRMLLRLGLDAAKNRPPLGTFQPGPEVLSRESLAQPLQSSPAATVPKSSHPNIDAFMAQGYDITQFVFGQKQ